MQIGERVDVFLCDVHRGRTVPQELDQFMVCPREPVEVCAEAASACAGIGEGRLRDVPRPTADDYLEVDVTEFLNVGV